MLACLALKYRYHEKNFCREVREPKGCRKAVGKTNTHTHKKRKTPKGPPLSYGISHTQHILQETYPSAQGKIKYVSLLPWLWVENYSKNRPERTIYKGWQLHFCLKRSLNLLVKMGFLLSFRNILRVHLPAVCI